MRNYEVTFIVDPVLSGDEMKMTAKTYEDLIKDEGLKIVHLDSMGLKQLTYPIRKRSSGVYYCIEFEGDKGAIIPKLELALRRDERIMRFLTVKLDRYGVKYNDDKRNGLIGTQKKEEEKKEKAAFEARLESEKKTQPSAKKEVAETPALAPAAVAETIEAPVKEAVAETTNETPAPAVVAETTETPAKEANDDLTKIEGIGPKISEALVEAGVSTYSKLADSNFDTLRGILDGASSTFAPHDPTTWPRQAGMAASGNWEELKTLQDELLGGRPEASSEEE